MPMLSQPKSYCCLKKGRLYHRLSLFACQTRRLLHPVSFINYCPNHYVWPIHNYNNETIVKHGQISELALSAYIILTWIASCKDWFKESPTNHPNLHHLRQCNEMVFGSYCDMLWLMRVWPLSTVLPQRLWSDIAFSGTLNFIQIIYIRLKLKLLNIH